jgi:hypothetical protein
MAGFVTWRVLPVLTAGQGFGAELVYEKAALVQLFPFQAINSSLTKLTSYIGQEQ